MNIPQKKTPLPLSQNIVFWLWRQSNAQNIVDLEIFYKEVDT